MWGLPLAGAPDLSETVGAVPGVPGRLEGYPPTQTEDETIHALGPCGLPGRMA